jgi:hypothetical protein
MRTNPQDAQLIAPVGGKYGEWCRKGYIYVARSGAAAAIPVNTALTNSPTLWNPSNSEKCVIPLSISFSAAGLGTQVIDGFTLSYLLNTGEDVATGRPMVTFTNIPPVAMNLKRSISVANPAKTRFANAVVTFTTQPAALIDLGMGQWVSGTAATGIPYNGHVYKFDGELELEPGTSISVGAATAATSGTYWTSIVFAEIPRKYYEGEY